MGILNNGLFGGFEKRIGPVVGRKVRRRNVVSMVQRKNLKLPAAGRVLQNGKFGLVLAFLYRFKDLIAIGFRHDKKRNAINAAAKYNFPLLLSGVAPDFFIDPAKLVYSRGRLAIPNSPKVLLAPDQQVLFSWYADVQNQYNRNTDRACFLVYCPVNDLVISAVGSALRSDLGYGLSLPPDLVNGRLYCFMSMVSADGREVSDSVYLGRIDF